MEENNYVIDLKTNRIKVGYTTRRPEDILIDCRRFCPDATVEFFEPNRNAKFIERLFHMGYGQYSVKHLSGNDSEVYEDFPIKMAIDELNLITDLVHKREEINHLTDCINILKMALKMKKPELISHLKEAEDEIHLDVIRQCGSVYLKSIYREAIGVMNSRLQDIN